jgi:hypothetical protein
MNCAHWDIMKLIVWLLAFEFFSAFIYLDVGGWIILKWILDRMGWYGMDWLDLAQDRALVNMVMNL